MTLFPFPGDELITAENAVSALCNVGDDQVEDVLGFPIITKVRRYANLAIVLLHTSTTCFQQN